jgi:hypothetical protein
MRFFFFYFSLRQRVDLFARGRASLHLSFVHIPAVRILARGLALSFPLIFRAIDLAMGVEEPVLPSGHAPDSDNNEEVVKSVPYHRRTIRNYMTSIPILLCCLTSGLVDSAVFNAWGVFATMQTGTPTRPSHHQSPLRPQK